MPTFTTVPDKNAGDVFTEAMWDTYLRDNVNGLLVPPMCRVYANASQTIGNGADTAVTWDQEHVDTDGMHSTSVNTSRITMATAGVYLVTAAVAWDINGTGYRYLNIRHNGSQKIGMTDAPAAAGDYILQTASAIYSFSVGEYVEAVVYQNSGGNVNLLQNTALGVNAGPHLSAAWLGKVS